MLGTRPAKANAFPLSVHHCGAWPYLCSAWAGALCEGAAYVEWSLNSYSIQASGKGLWIKAVFFFTDVFSLPAAETLTTRV